MGRMLSLLRKRTKKTLTFRDCTQIRDMAGKGEAAGIKILVLLS
jgi:hypothetical protein